MRLSELWLTHPLCLGQLGGLSRVRLGPAEGHLLYRVKPAAAWLSESNAVLSPIDCLE